MGEIDLIVVGLTGGIASGKSTLSRLFEKLGAVVIDADCIAREAVSVGNESYFRIVDQFGEKILNEDGTIDRKKLGLIIFSDPVQKEKLNAIVHPHVKKVMNERVEAFRILRPESIVILDVPLLIEAGMQENLKEIILVWVPYHIQLKRLMRRDSLSEREARARIDSQMPIDHKKKYASHLIDNSGTIESVMLQAEHVYTILATEENRDIR